MWTNSKSNRFPSNKCFGCRTVASQQERRLYRATRDKGASVQQRHSYTTSVVAIAEHCTSQAVVHPSRKHPLQNLGLRQQENISATENTFLVAAYSDPHWQGDMALMEGLGYRKEVYALKWASG
jgi:hypothetical protein